MISQIARASLRSEILIDFNCYIDTEVGLIRLIREKYLDEKVFNVDLLRSNLRIIIKMLMERKEVNPLYLFANKDISRKDLDDYYQQFMDEEYDNILSIVIFGSIPNVAISWIISSSIGIIILLISIPKK